MAQELSVVFGDGRAIEDLMRIVASKSAEPAARRDAMRVLVEARAAGLSALLCKLIDERDIGADAVRGLAVFDDPAISELLIKGFRNLREPARAAAVVTLSSRPAWARMLLEAVAGGTVDRTLVPTFHVRQMSNFPDDDIRKKVAVLWPDLRPIGGAKQERIEKLKKTLAAAELSTANLSNGRHRFVQACATCHTLFSEGAKIGPDLTGAQRANLVYLLENIVDPSATTTPAYRMSTIVLADGRVLGGLVGDQSGPTIAIQTPTERLVVAKSEVEEIHPSDRSLMPDGLLDVLSEKEIRDLIAYLMSSVQVPLPVDQPIPATGN
jgi:putative heme-binding domain-containing protein